MITGKTVSHYEIVEKLGEGGMGVVFKARDLSLHRFVALKFLPPEITASIGRVARFEAEARAISALNHPNIATIHAMDEDEGRRFLVLEYLEGGTLRERMKHYRASELPFPLHEAVELGVQLGEGLAHAHERGIVHRDIKPENVMFTGGGTLRVTDFGLAKSSHASEITRDGTTVGTAAYMAPEQALRNETTPRADLFAFGVVLYEVVAGRRPFLGATELATLHAILNEDPPPLHLLRPDVPPELERILDRLLTKDPAQRCQTAQDLVRELKALRIDVPAFEVHTTSATRSLTTVMPLQAAVPPRRVLRRGRWITASAALAALLGVGLWKAMPRKSAVAESELAVLPFSASSANPEDKAFGAGLSGIVAGRLASLGANVVPQEDLERNRVTSPAEARRVFGIPVVLTGRIDRNAEGGHVTLQIVDTGSGKVVRSLTSTTGQDEVLSAATTLTGISPDAVAMNRLRAQNTRTANAYDYYVLGNGYLQRWDQAGNPGFAIAAFRKAIQLDPTYALAYAGLGAAYWRRYDGDRDQQDMEQAREAAMQALSRNPTLDSPHVTLGAIAVATGQVDEGIRQLRLALERDPVNAEACRELANALVAAGRVSEAEATYRRAIQYRPTFWLGYDNLGVFLNDRGRYQEAVEALQKAASLTPDNYLVYRNLGGVQTALGDWKSAEASFRKALDLRPLGSVYSNLGTLYIYAGRYSDAIQMLEKAAAMSGRERHTYLIWGNLGDAYRWTHGRDKEAAGAYNKAIELATEQLTVNPDDATLLSRLAVYSAKAGQPEEAEHLIARALKAAPRDSSVLYRSAIVYEVNGKRARGAAALNSAIAAGYSTTLAEREPELAAVYKTPSLKPGDNRKP